MKLKFFIYKFNFKIIIIKTYIIFKFWKEFFKFGLSRKTLNLSTFKFVSISLILKLLFLSISKSILLFELIFNFLLKFKSFN